MIPVAPPIPGMKPPDAEASLRSLPDRYRSLLERIPVAKRDLLDEKTGPDGVTPLALLTSVAHDLAELEGALRDVLHLPNAALAMNPLNHEPTDEPYLGLELALDRVERNCGALADLAAEANRSVNDWSREAEVPGGKVGAWDIARTAVELSVHRLRLIDSILARI